jgi:hypothetical protein
LHTEARRLKGETKMNLKKILFVAILGIVAFPAFASAKASRPRHTQARKMHFAKFRIKR